MSGLTAGRIAEILNGGRFSYAAEDGLQAAIASLLQQHSIPVEREVILAGAGRIDLCAYPVPGQRIGIEVKVGGTSREAERQLRRYAATGLFNALILVTSRVRHHMPASIDVGDRSIPVLTVCIVLGGL